MRQMCLFLISFEKSEDITDGNRPGLWEKICIETFVDSLVYNCTHIPVSMATIKVGIFFLKCSRLICHSL